MTSNRPQPRFQLYYWPLPFRGCFVSYLFAYQDVPLLEVGDYEKIRELISLNPSEQGIPFIGPPVFRDLESGRTLSQMPAIVLYASHELGLSPERPFDVASSMKILMDCNDVLMEICRYNGSSMWQRDEWKSFRAKRFTRWLDIFEECLNRGFFGNDTVTFADIGVYALFGNMIRCLPDLEPDVLNRAPGVHAHCQRIGLQPSLAKFIAEQEQKYGNLYCGGQIEQSIREMLAIDEKKTH